MRSSDWEIKLARRLAWITLAGGVVSWTIRQVRLGIMPDALNFYLAAFLITISFFLYLRLSHRVIIGVLILNMVFIAMWVIFSTSEARPRPGALLILVTASTLAAAYYGFVIPLLLTIASAIAMVAFGYYAHARAMAPVEGLPAGMTHFSNWLSTAAGYATMSTLSIALVSYAVGELKESLQRLRHALAESETQKEILEDKERLLTLFTELSSDYVYQIDLQHPDLVPEVFAGAFKRTTGYEPEEIRSKGGWMSIVHPEDQERLTKLVPRLLEATSLVSEYRIISASGKTVWLRDHVKPVRDENSGAVIKLLGAVHDISERKSAEQQVENLAFYDPLTALPNRRLLLDRLEQALALSARTQFYGAILFIDLDHFKNLNDTRGHEAGDQLLIQQARRVVRCVREGDTVARLGGDEFIVILDELAATADSAAGTATEVAQRIIEAVAKPVSLTQQMMTDYENTCSIGVAMFRGHELTIDELLRRADLAMYQAKADGRNTFRFFDPDMQRLLSERLSLEEDLKQALTQRQFLIYLQPQIAADGKVVGAEALLRWQHPTMGMIAPGTFIATAERTGAILEIGKWVLEQCCGLLRKWSAHPQARHLKLAINVSARQFKQRDCGQIVKEALQRTGADGALLDLELTESLAIDNIEDTVVKMKALREMGVGLSLDDFGTGHSSLAYLKRLPLTQLKIDQSFVRDITTDANDAVLVQTIIGMAQNLKLEVIAEGVETEEQRQFLEQNGCRLYQGYLFDRPMPVTEFERKFIP